MNNALPTAYFSDLAEVIQSVDVSAVINIASVIRDAASKGGMVYVVGNGGSAANAAHLALHLREVGLTAVDLLADVPTLTALSNDYSYADAPALRIMQEGQEGDVLVVISGSGNSDNVIKSLAAANEEGMTTVGLLGFSGGQARGMCNHTMVLHSDDYGVVEDTHSAVIHVLKYLLVPEDASNSHHPV